MKVEIGCKWFVTADCKKVDTARFGNKQNTSKPSLRVCRSWTHLSVTTPLFIIGGVQYELNTLLVQLSDVFELQ